MSTAVQLPRIRVVLAHLPGLTRDLISRTLKDEPAIDVVHEVTDAGRSARQLIDETDPDLVIVGAEKPGLLAECRELLDERAPLRVLAVSGDGREARLYGLRPYEVILGEFSCDSVLELAGSRTRNSRTAHRAAETQQGFDRAEGTTMMRWIVGSSLRFRLLVVAIAAAMLVVGTIELRETPADVLPEFAPPTVEIQTEALGLSAAEVEQMITVPLEQDLLVGVAFLEDIRSESVPGLSRILLVFEPGTNVYRARQVVAERLTQAHALPQVSKPPRMLQPLSSTNRVLMVGVSSKTVSPIEMSVLARWTIAPRLMGVPGVANVSIWGQRDRQLQVQVDPERLRDQDVSLLQVVETAGNALWVSPLTFVEASTPGTGGFIDTPNQRLGVQHLLPISNAADLAQIRVDDTNGRNLSLGDVASVVEGHQPLIGDAVQGDGSGLLLVIEKFPEASTRDVTHRVEAAIGGMQPGLSGLQFDTGVYRPASYIEKSLDNLTLAMIIGGALLILVFGAFFFSWRTALVALVAIPVSLLAGVLVLAALGETFNTMVLVGLAAALMLVIGDALVDVENIARRLRQRRGQGARKRHGARHPRGLARDA